MAEMLGLPSSSEAVGNDGNVLGMAAPWARGCTSITAALQCSRGLLGWLLGFNVL